jgi:hypothetical protein
MKIQTSTAMGFDYFEGVVNVAGGAAVPATIDLLAVGSMVTLGLAKDCPTDGGAGRPPAMPTCPQYFSEESGTLTVSTASITTPGAFRATANDVVMRDVSNAINCVKVPSMSINASW